jgi:hypothetical protein
MMSSGGNGLISQRTWPISKVTIRLRGDTLAKIAARLSAAQVRPLS